LKNHIGFYPTPSGVQAFIKETAKYASTKGAIQFPLDEPLPLKLVSKIVKFRVKENLQQAELKSRRKAISRFKDSDMDAADFTDLRGEHTRNLKWPQQSALLTTR